MFRSFFVFITILILISACTPALQATPQPDQPTTTSSPPPTATPTRTALPSATPTASITPLPTIPTFTPTFDVSTIVTVTPATEAECPKEDPNLKPDLKTLVTQAGLPFLEDQVLLFLNSGGIPRAIVTALLDESRWFHPDMGIQKDITGDGVAEFILTDRNVVYVFGCKDKKYQTLLSDTDDLAWMQNIRFKITEDMNLNGIPEIITDEQGGHNYPSERVSILEWNGQKFLPLLQGENFGNNEYFTVVDTPVLARITENDTDGNGTLELVLESDLPIPVPSKYDYLIPWRNEIDIYAWNGTHYILNRTEYSSPEFHFQALQDADHEVGYGNFDRALSFYQDVISNSKLKAFSPEIAKNEVAKSYANDENQPVPTPVSHDSTEYPRLAAYAYYRIMLIHFVQGHESDASTVYNTLQEKFGNDPHGRPYVEMATAFWEAYQSTHRMYDGCTAAIQYAAENPDILIPLGSDYHGWQSHQYKPEDVCPFR